MTKKKYTFAISIRDDINEKNLFSNGLSQNIIFLYDLFELLGHKVILLVQTKRESKKLKLPSNKKYTILTTKELVQKKQSIDIVFELGQIIDMTTRTSLLGLGAKIVTVHCGNQLIMDMELLVYDDGENAGRRHISDYVEHVWILPHHAHQLTYMEVLTGAKVNICPYVWEPDFLSKKHKQSLTYREVPNIYVMEPNISVVKNALIPLAIIESVHRKKPDSFHKAYIVNGDVIANHNYFLNNIASNFHCANACISGDKLFFTPRASFNDVFTHYDVLLSHHWRNSLNNLSFEALYYNIPFVHNSEPMKDVGYFYPDFDVRLGTAALENALKNLNKDLKEYESRNVSFLKTASIYNKDVQDRYNELINDVLHPS